jgi:hypothetical protein
MFTNRASSSGPHKTASTVDSRQSTANLREREDLCASGGLPKDTHSRCFTPPVFDGSGSVAAQARVYAATAVVRKHRLRHQAAVRTSSPIIVGEGAVMSALRVAWELAATIKPNVAPQWPRGHSRLSTVDCRREAAPHEGASVDADRFVHESASAEPRRFESCHRRTDPWG